MMSESDTQRLREINSELLDLYLKLNQDTLEPDEEQSVRVAIFKLEAEKNDLPNELLLDNKVQQYVTILRSAASSLQLQRQTEHQYAEKMSKSPAPDEIRQRNINLNKRKTIEKKIETYRQKLLDLGLQPFEIDNIVLEGYREQSQRYSESLLRSFESTITDYLEEYYQDNQTLPEDVLALIGTWDQTEKRADLTYSQLRILEMKEKCLRRGIPLAEIERRVPSISQWDESKKQTQLRLLKSKLEQEIATRTEDMNIIDDVTSWQEFYESGKRLKPNQTQIITLINEMRMYGVPQTSIDNVLKSFSPPKAEGRFSAFKNRLRRNSKDGG